jgi:hypothetical protein
MAKWEFYDEDDEMELNEHDSEPSFSFYDFKKWLSKEKRQPASPISESSAAVSGISQSSKEELKELFKKRVRAKVQKKIDKKMEERKKDS